MVKEPNFPVKVIILHPLAREYKHFHTIPCLGAGAPLVISVGNENSVNQQLFVWHPEERKFD